MEGEIKKLQEAAWVLCALAGYTPTVYETEPGRAKHLRK